MLEGRLMAQAIPFPKGDKEARDKIECYYKSRGFRTYQRSNFMIIDKGVSKNESNRNSKKVR